MSETTDVTVRNEGTILLFRPVSEQAREWLSENVQSDATWFGRALVVEHRYADGLIEGLESAGLSVGPESF